MIYLRTLFFDWLVRFVERELYRTPIVYALDAERSQKYLELLWYQPGFRETCIERETRFVHAIAAQQDKDPVQQAIKQAQLRGQRMENMLLFRKAQKAASLGKGDDKNASSPKR